ncbi:MAG: fibronectin type III domain-containing protein, partial [Thiotrichaceae bacterium]|nr:fibronectin type III domain-containing protein [Thiotrichaceae bacterium]
AQWGGALNIKGSADIQNSTFFANTATTHGGAIKVVDGSEINLTYVTIAGNTATDAGGGINVESGDSVLNMTGVLLADNTAANVGNDCNITTGGTITGTNTFNLIENNECGITPLLTADPSLATLLADNGGSTQTLKLQNTDSVAVDAIDETTCITLEIETDQRGITRPQENGCDIGAYELEFNLATAPTDLILTPSSQTEIKLDWTDASSDETGFKVLREGVEIIALALNTNTFTDNGLTCGTTYNYEVYASNGAGDSTPALTGSQASADCTILVAPSNLTASVESNEQIRLSWTDNSSDEINFNLLRDNTLIATIAADSTAYTDSGLSCETAYTYTLYASNTGGDSASVTVTGNSGECPDNSANPPNAPANLVTEALSETQIKLTWLDDSAIEDGYSVLRNGAFLVELAANSTSFTDQNLTCGTDYTYSIFATNQYGDSEHLTQNDQTLACGSDILPPLPVDPIDPTTQPTTDPTNGNTTDGTNSSGGVTTDPTLNPPSNLSATLKPDNTVELAWLDNSDREIGFIVQRNNQILAELAENTQAFTDTFIQCGFVYDYVVMATDGNANSLAATMTIVAPLCDTNTDIPTTEFVETPTNIDTNILTPYNLIVTAISPSEINLTWSDDNLIHSGHYIERDGIGITTVAANTHSFINRNLHCEQTYTYSVQTTVDNFASEAAHASVLMPACPTQTTDNATNVDSEGNALFSLTILTAGEGGVFECGQQCVQEYLLQTEVFLIADPVLNWEFIGWTGACDEAGRVVMNKNQQCTANFALINDAEQPATTQAEVSLQLNVEGEGSIQNCGNACTYVYPHGTDVVLNALPAQGWTFKDWRGLCNFGHIRLEQDITLCTAVFELLPDLSQAEAPQNTDTIQIENGQINNGNIPQNGSVSHIHFIGDNQNNGLVTSVTIEQNAHLQGGRLSGSNVNYGTVQDVNIRPYSELEGGRVQGDVQNDGTLRNVSIEDGATVSGGGSLGGKINNGGKINDMVLEPDTIIIGGELTGIIVGDLEQPARIGDTIINYAVISNMCLTPTVELGAGVIIGQNVTLPNTEGNLTILDFCVYQTEVKEINQNDLAGRIEPAAFSTFTPEMMKQLPPEDMALLTEEGLAFLDSNAAKQMTGEQFENILLESLKGLAPETLDALPVNIVKNMNAEQIANLDQEQFKDETGDKTKQSRAVTKLLTNISKQVLKDSGIDPADLLPENWQIDPETQEIKPSVGSRVVYKSFELQNKHENLNMPETPDFSSGFGINGEGTPLIDNLNQGLGQTQLDDASTPLFRLEDVSKFRFKQKDNSILNVLGSAEFSDFVFSFLPDTSTIQQTDKDEVSVGLTQVAGGFLQITMPNNQQFVMIPSPDKPDELHAIFGEDAIIQINDKGEVFITYIDGDTVRFLVIMFNALVENDTDSERLVFIADITSTRSRNSRAIREGRVVFSDGTAQNVYPAVLYPELLIGLLSQIGAENVIYNVDGTFSLSFNGQVLTLLPTYDTQAQSLDVWERIDSSLNVENNELVYSVQDTNTSQLMTFRLVISF